MFEFFLTIKYLIPRKRTLSTSLIAFVSIFVISLVVWLVLVFLSVTNGIEETWVKKLTSLNAPLRISPTDDYYSSYYYQIDKISERSNFSTKTIEEKYKRDISDPYSPDLDMEIPPYIPSPIYKEGRLLDPVKELFSSLDKKGDSLSFQDFEITGALMKLHLRRGGNLTFLSQLSYLLSLSEKNPSFKDLIVSPSEDDLNNILRNIINEKNSRIRSFFNNISIKKLITKKSFSIPKDMLKNLSFTVFASIENGEIKRIILPKTSSNSTRKDLKKGVLFSKGKKLFLKIKKEYEIDKKIEIEFLEPHIFNAKLIKTSINNNPENILVEVDSKIQKNRISALLKLKDFIIYKADAKNIFSKKPLFPPPWVYRIDSKIILPNNRSTILPISLKKSGALLGDLGYFSYSSPSITSTNEHKLPLYVAGFYDPGIVPIGNRCIIVSKDRAGSIASSNSSFSPEGIPTNGIFLWSDNSKVDKIKKEIQKELEKRDISHFWKVESYKDYKFSKPLFEQFQSDKMIFTLIAIIILIVASSNIISLLSFLVNDKKEEIAILRALGASKWSIALIFGSCGIFIGAISSLIGSIAAWVTLKNLDILVKFLSFLRGHEAFNQIFFGDKLPNVLSKEALLFVLVATPIIALISGLIPAIKATKISPSKVLRSN